MQWLADREIYIEDFPVFTITIRAFADRRCFLIGHSYLVK